MKLAANERTCASKQRCPSGSTHKHTPNERFRNHRLVSGQQAATRDAAAEPNLSTSASINNGDIESTTRSPKAKARKQKDHDDIDKSYSNKKQTGGESLSLSPCRSLFHPPPPHHTLGGLGARGREARALKLKGWKDVSHSTSSAAASLDTCRPSRQHGNTATGWMGIKRRVKA